MALYRCMTSGSGVKYASGTLQGSTSSTTHINIGFKPKKLHIYGNYSTNSYNYQYAYDENLSTTQYLSNMASTPSVENLGSGTNNRLASIDSDGFTMEKQGSGVAGKTFCYVAIG